jgi:hypothetical protein
VRLDPLPKVKPRYLCALDANCAFRRSSGSNEFPKHLAADWLYWKTGNVEFFDFLSRLPHLLGTIGAGAV